MFQEFFIKVLMTAVLIKLKKLNPNDWPRLTCSTKRNIFLSYDVTYTEGLGMQCITILLMVIIFVRKAVEFRKLCGLCQIQSGGG